ncbi:unnamed protein product [Dracunculus medinensis]|uniref:Solute carrier family 12 member 6 n=1 Tax=Dracunculus medinensis TaxID=318479 RepID=A0A158Q328_DRAME|nr:unnamed protein product [Dracunculus medinensis]
MNSSTLLVSIGKDSREEIRLKIPMDYNDSDGGNRETSPVVNSRAARRSTIGEDYYTWGQARESFAATGNNLALFDEPSAYFISTHLKGFTTPGPLEREQSQKKKADLGVMLGVYLPTIQHILGVTMFIRLFWVVGMAGIAQTFFLLFLCCFCTFLTCISLSAVATNGTVESGGAYFMISRNLGPEFGSAVGILFYLANTVAVSMYLVGGVEIILLYIFPDLTIGGSSVHSDTGPMGMMSHNLRIYATVLLLIEFVIVAMGVRFVQLFAPISLLCVIVSILAVYAGGIEKTINPSSGSRVCMLGNHLLQAKVVLPSNASISDLCFYCNASSSLQKAFCNDNSCSDLFKNNRPRCVNGYPGFGSSAFLEGEYLYGSEANKKVEVFQDVTTTFFVLLAIYFPAVTGILTGANMSGDLKNPQSSIPCGTIAAQLTTSFVYFSLAFVFGATIDGFLLRDKYGKSLGGGMIVANLAWPSPWVLLVGSFTSTFGAALQCLCSAPRLLQSIAKDDVIPALKIFATVTKNNEPFTGLILTTMIAELAILMGAMDQIAAVVDFFFLMCYAFVNLICALHSILGAPNWRPRHYHYLVLLFAFLLCLVHTGIMPFYLAYCVVLFTNIAKKEWGDGFRGLALTTAQYSLMKIDEKDPHPKNFRPQILLLLSIPWSKDLVDVRYQRLLNLSSQLKASRGLTVVVALIRGNPLSVLDQKNADEIKKRIEFDMHQLRLKGFAKSIIYGESQIGGCVSTIIQSVGMGGLRPNTLLLSWPKEKSASDSVDSEYQTFTDKLHAGVAMEMCLLVAKGITDFPMAGMRLTGTMDVYWIVQDGGLCVLVSYLLGQSKIWRGCKLRIIAVAQEMDNNNKMQADLQNYLYQLRVDARILIVELSDPKISKDAFERTLLMEERSKLQAAMQEQKLKTQNLYDSVESKFGITDGENGIDEELAGNKRTDNYVEGKKIHKVLKMHTAVRLNEIILEHSADSQLILLNLPKPPVGREGLDDYMHYLQVLSDGISRILFVRGTGKEVITTSIPV